MALAAKDGIRSTFIFSGDEGAPVFYELAFHGRVKGVEVKAIDTTGAGDAFVAAVLSQLVRDRSLFQNEQRLREALQFANVCGAIATTEKGAIPALPDTAAVLNIYHEQGSGFLGC